METQGFQYLAMFFFRSAIDRVPDQGVADRGHMDTHLMRAPGFEPAFDQRRLVKLTKLTHLPMRHRALAAGDDRQQRERQHEERRDDGERRPEQGEGEGL